MGVARPADCAAMRPLGPVRGGGQQRTPPHCRCDAARSLRGHAAAAGAHAERSSGASEREQQLVTALPTRMSSIAVNVVSSAPGPSRAVVVGQTIRSERPCPPKTVQPPPTTTATPAADRARSHRDGCLRRGDWCSADPPQSRSWRSLEHSRRIRANPRLCSVGFRYAGCDWAEPARPEELKCGHPSKRDQSILSPARRVTEPNGANRTQAGLLAPEAGLVDRQSPGR